MFCTLAFDPAGSAAIRSPIACPASIRSQLMSVRLMGSATPRGEGPAGPGGVAAGGAPGPPPGAGGLPAGAPFGVEGLAPGAPYGAPGGGCVYGVPGAP